MDDNSRLIGESPAFLDVMERASAAAALNRPVLVIGERGTGKELVAERLHRLSDRWDRRFVQMNCAALTETLIDAELFGYEPGAFTGATKTREGRFEEADGGSLFLDEIATLSAQAQEKLLRVVEYGQLQRLGSNAVRTVDVRVIGATNIDLPAAVAAGAFRADLLDRLSFEVITLPPLRARGEDIPLLADFFARRMSVELGWPTFPGFSRTARTAMRDHGWPGNVRELKNVVERAVYRWPDPERAIEDISFDPFASPWRPAGQKADGAAQAPPRPDTVPAIPAPEVVGDLRTAVAAFEKSCLEQAMLAARYNQRQAASALGLSYDQLRHALKKHGML